MRVFWGLCRGCARYNPKSVGNCIFAKDVGLLERKHGFKLMVTDCPLLAPIEVVFPDEPKEEPEEEAPKKKKKKKVKSEKPE